jgi:CDP-glycerol glycerophosphotransferase
MKKLIKTIIYKCPPLRRSAVRVRDRIDAHSYLRRYGSNKTDEKRILFCAYSGRQYACSPKAIYEELKKDQTNEYRFVWAFKEKEKFAELAADERTKLVTYGSKEFLKELSICKYWVFNTRVPGGIVKKADQVYVQTWHGTPLKRLGFDVADYISNAADDKKSLRYSYSSDAKRYDFFLSPSPYYTKKMTSAFNLKALGKEDAILELGYPRNDSLYTASKEEILQIRNCLGIRPEEKVILYAPTWRESALDPAKGSSYGKGIEFQLGLDLKKLLKDLGEEYKILLRTHYFIRDNIDFSAYGDRLMDVSDYRDINALYLAADLLITDYSSVFFDYAILKKPMLFYMYDLDSYQGIRDFYIGLEELPGRIITREEVLAAVIRQSIADGIDQERYDKFNHTFNPYPGPVAKKVWDAIISQKG